MGPDEQPQRPAQTMHLLAAAGARPRVASSEIPASPTQELENETETGIENLLVAQERELGAETESLTTVLKEVSELSAKVS